MDFLKDERFKGIEKFERKVWLSSPTMHGDEQRWVDDAIQTNWVSTVGANIKRLRRERGMKQIDLAKKTRIQRETISKYENGVHEPTVSILNKLADALNVSVDQLIARDKIIRTETDENLCLIMSKYEIKFILVVITLN